MKTTYHFDPEKMRLRFHALAAERQRIEEQDVLPLRAQLDETIAKIHALEAEMKPIETAFREKRATLAPIDQEMAVISRALKGETALPSKE